MKPNTWRTYAFWIGLSEAIGFVAGLSTQDAVKIYSESITQPPLAPPSIVFFIVWTILYALMGFSAARISLQPPSAEQKRGLDVFLVQLFVNFLWSFLFFSVQAFGLAFFWLLFLWGLVLWMIMTFWKVDPLAAKLQIPYLIWLTFAAYLSLGVWVLNG